MPKVSIIIPVYNVESYIERCMHSVMRQTFSDIECILVDDCGTDNSIAIAEKMILHYYGPITFRILHHDINRGLSASRNTGICEAKGEYLFFLDSDDWISPDCISLMVKSMNQEDSIEMVMGGIKRVGDEMRWTHFLKKGVYTSNFIDHACSYRIYTMAWNKLIRTNFILDNNLFFKEGLLHEDVLWNVQVACYLKKIISIEEITYFYLIREGSIQTNKTQDLHQIHLGDVKINLIKFVFERGFQNNKTLYYFIANDLHVYICYKKKISKKFYENFRQCPYWSIPEQRRFGTTKLQLLLSLNRYLPTYMGLFYYRLLYRILH